MASPLSVRALRPWLAGALLFALAPPAPAQVATSGYFEYLARREEREGARDLSADYATLRLDAATYLWEPWIAQLRGGIGMTFSRVEEDGVTQSGEDVTGEGRLMLFPRSHFPFETFVERRDSRIDGEVAGPDFTLTTYGFSQSYAPLGGPRASLQARRSERDEERGSEPAVRTRSTDDFVSLDLSHGFGANLFDVRTDFSRGETDQPQHRETLRELQMLRHRYGTDGALSLENLLTRTDDRQQDGTLESRLTQTQLNSTGFWRPDTERPTLVTGSVLLTGFETETFGNESDTRLSIFTGGVTHQASPALTVQGNTSVAQRRAGEDESTATLARGTATYAPAPIPFGALAYNWSVNGDVARRADDSAPEPVIVDYLLGFAHNLRYTTGLFNGTFGAGAGQQIAHLEDTADRSEDDLTHSFTLDWSQTESDALTYVRLFGSDTRRDAELDTGFRLVNLQASRMRQINRSQSVTGNITVQRTSTFVDDERIATATTSAVDLTYRHQRAFGVPQLRFSSEIRYYTDELGSSMASDLGVTQRRTDQTWTNRFDYSIGRLELSARLVLAEIDDRSQELWLFQARRYFGNLR